MKKTLVIVISIVLLAAVSLAVTGQEKEMKMKGKGMKAKMPPADAEACWMYMTKMSPYHGWGYWPGHAGIKEGKSPHGKFVRVTANPVALMAARKGMKEMPDGALIMKENFDADRKLVALTPMYKVKGYNPEGGDWFWMKLAPDGTVEASGKLKGCVGCHAKVKKNDWIFHVPENE